MDKRDWDARLRRETFAWLREPSRYEAVIDRNRLEKAFTLEGRTVSLMGPKGIFTPKDCLYPLSVTTVWEGPYSDHFADEDRLLYSYRGAALPADGREYPDNLGLRRAMTDRIPLVYFCAVARGRYYPAWPVYIVADDPQRRIFTLVTDFVTALPGEGNPPWMLGEPDDPEIRRRWSLATVRVRYHQQAFRERVIEAYRSHCAMCRLRERSLLDAAHIIGDAEPAGTAAVTNGLALCKIHHAAFDQHLLAVRPDYRIEVSPRILTETDGPMLEIGFQALHGTTIWLPGRARDRPSRERLEERWQRFREAS